MTLVKKIICINCPMGCRLQVTTGVQGELQVEGNQCSRGRAYALKELTTPTRVLTTTIKLKNGLYRRLPVRTVDGIPKEKLTLAMAVLNRIEVEAPVQAGDIIINNLLGTNVDVIASRSA